MPAHHTLEAYLDTYIEAAGIRDGGQSPGVNPQVPRDPSCPLESQADGRYNLVKRPHMICAKRTFCGGASARAIFLQVR